MPTDNLTASGAGTEVVVGAADATVSLAGAWAGSVRLERRTSSSAAWRPVSIDVVGNPAVFRAPIGDMLVPGVPSEPDARLRWFVDRYESGTIAARIGVA